VAVLIFKRLGMKKSDITISLIIIVVCILLMVMLWLRTVDGGGTAPSYSFLAGRNPITCKIANKGIEDSSGKEDRRYIYSFEADFNDLCSKADAELIPAGFASNNLVFKNLSGTEFPYRAYWLQGRFPRGMVWVYIYSKVQYIELPDSKKGVSSEKDGWVKIDIVYWRGWQWPF
jgi:hypothetical protein